MALTRMITHRIQRQDPNAEATLSLRDHCLGQNGRIEECFRELKHGVIKRLGKEYGRFSDDIASHPVSNWLREYIDDKLSFESFSQKAMSQLKATLDNTEEPLDSFIFFAHETQESVEYCHIFMVQHNTGQFIDGELEINESFYLDTKGVVLAAKVNITDWQSGDEQRAANALTLLRWRGEKELSDAFIAFIGLAEKVDVGADTESFLGLVSDYTKDLPDDVAHQTKKQVVNYCLEQDKMGKPVVMAELSSELSAKPASQKSRADDNESEQEEHLEGDAHLQMDLPPFANFIEQKQPETKKELIPDTSQLRQFVRLSGRTNQMSMSFASSCLGDSIVYDPATDSLTINEIPPKLKARLAKLIQES